MNQIVAGSGKDDFIKLIFIKIIELGFFYLRNIFLVGAAMFIFLTLVVIFTFYQEELGIDPIGSILLFLDSAPLIGEMIDIPERIQVGGDDIVQFFLKVSFYLTIFTETLRYIKIYVFKKKDRSRWEILRKRIIFSVIGISVMYSFSCIYVIMSTGGRDAVGFLVIFIISWIICCISATLFFLVDFFAKKVHKIIDRINTAPINSPQ